MRGEQWLAPDRSVAYHELRARARTRGNRCLGGHRRWLLWAGWVWLGMLFLSRCCALYAELYVRRDRALWRCMAPCRSCSERQEYSSGCEWPQVLLADVADDRSGGCVFDARLVVPLFSSDREQALHQRVDVLTRSRREALDVQEAELRRLERDLHDGAQAQLYHWE